LTYEFGLYVDLTISCVCNEYADTKHLLEAKPVR